MIFNTSIFVYKSIDIKYSNKTEAFMDTHKILYISWNSHLKGVILLKQMNRKQESQELSGPLCPIIYVRDQIYRFQQRNVSKC